MLAEYALLRRGPLTMAPSQLGLFTRSDRDQARANLQYHVQPLSLDRFGEPLHKFPAFTASVANLRPTSRGIGAAALTRSGRRAGHQSRIISSTDEDRRIAVSAIRLTRRIAAQPALAPFHPDEYLPGPSVRDDDDAALAKAAGDIGTTIFHPVGTAKMGLASDPMTVVDDRLRVAGIERLRVIDASVMPTITSGNTNAPTMMIAEKGAALLRADAKGIMNPARRAKDILVDPVAEWARIEQETGDPAFVLTRYVAVFALVPALFGFIGTSVIGVVVPGAGAVRAPIFDGLFGAIFGYVMACVTVLVLALIIDLVAPLFGGRRDFDSAFKLAVYSFTPVWLAGIFLVAAGIAFSRTDRLLRRLHPVARSAAFDQIAGHGARATSPS